MSLPTTFFIGRGGAGPIGTYTGTLATGTTILNGYGIEFYDPTFSTSRGTNGSVGAGNFGQHTFIVPDNCKKIRVILIGAGGGSSDNPGNVTSAEGGPGVEFLMDVSPGDTHVLYVGKGGTGVSTGTTFLGDGGPSYIFPANGGGSAIAYAYGGRSTEWTSNNQNTTVSADINGTQPSVTLLSKGSGGTGGTYGGSTPAAATLYTDPSYPGVIAHGGGRATLNSPFGTGIGFGGGGGRMGQTSTSYRVSGGIYGYAGGVGSSQGGYAGLGPVGGWANEYNQHRPTYNVNAGAGGGSFGGAGGDYYSGGFGAGGLVRIWWASDQGDPDWILSGGNYV